MAKAIEGLKTKPDFVLADAVTIPHINVPQKGIIHGDARSISIGAASIIAKVERDSMKKYIPDTDLTEIRDTAQPST